MSETVFRLLACDDHPPIRMALRLTLQRLHPKADMREVGSGQALLDVLAQPMHFDLLTLDMHLPDMPGLALLQKVKAMRPALPVVVLSADDSADTIMAALDQGATSYITKTSPEEVLIEALRSALSGQISLPRVSAPPAAPPPPATLADPMAELTPRQREVLQCLLRGMSAKQISRELNISQGTANDHTVAVFRHFHVRSRAMVIVEAQRRGVRLDLEA